MIFVFRLVCGSLFGGFLAAWVRNGERAYLAVALVAIVIWLLFVTEPVTRDQENGL